MYTVTADSKNLVTLITTNAKKLIRGCQDVNFSINLLYIPEQRAFFTLPDCIDRIHVLLEILEKLSLKR